MFNRRGFDRIAKYYDRLARLMFGTAILQSQTFFLDKIPASSSVLVLGGGTGWWMKKFLAGRPGCRILYIELSEQMIRLARKSVDGDNRVLFKAGTETSLAAEVTRFDAVITFYFLDLFPDGELPDVINKIRASIKPGALWLAADFMNTKWWHSMALFIMYRFFRLAAGLQNQELPDWTASILKLDLKEVDRKILYGGFMKTALYQVDF